MTSRKPAPNPLDAILEQLRAANRESVARLAVQEGLLSEERMQEALRSVDAEGGNLLDWLVRREWLKPADVSRLRKTLRPADVDPRIPSTLPASAAKDARQIFVPVVREERYRLGAEMGRGGLGCVYAAEDRDLRREVAIKLIREGLDVEFEERFVREARMTALLDHPNIVPVYDFGILNRRDPTDGRVSRQLFIAMKMIRGRTLQDVVHALRRGDAESLRAFTRTRLLGIFQSICLGVAYAHSRGVVHRDLKPANVMIGEFGETLVVDWGLAKTAGESEDSRGSSSPAPSDDGLSTQITLAGSVLGTPNYMPPEQAAGKLGEVEPRSDIYALGGILFTLLTWQTPGPRKTGLDGVAQPVPPDLDSLWRRAMAAKKEDRFQSAMEMHSEVQLFLEGAKARERADSEAHEHVVKGRMLMARFRELAGEVDAQAKVVKELSERIKPSRPAEEKRPLWEAQTRVKDERIEAFAAASAEFGQALTVKADSAEALDAKCEQFLERFLEAERQRDRKEMLLSRRMLESYDREGRYRAKLDAPGRLSIRTFAYRCGCLAPIRHPGWRVEIAETCTIPWQDGRPRPDLPVTDMDRPVPALRTFPEGVRWGHSGACALHEVQGADVWIARYEERDMRLQPGELRFLGKTPLSNVELPQGSYRCILKAEGFAEIFLPVRIDRGGVWTQDINLFRADEIPEGFCHVTGGPFVFGGKWAGGDEAERKTTEDVFIARFATTCAEYLEFLNALWADGNPDVARRRQPREGIQNWWIEEGGRFRLPTASEDPKMSWDPRWPVFSITWFDAVAYCAWRSKREGRTYRLMHEEEYEKAARGVDGRIYPYGDDFDGIYSHTSTAIPEKLSPMPVDSFPADESPFGVRGLSGGVEAWCFGTLEVPYREWRCLRGGAWSSTSARARPGARRGGLPTYLNMHNGFRLAAAPKNL